MKNIYEMYLKLKEAGADEEFAFDVMMSMYKEAEEAGLYTADDELPF